MSLALVPSFRIRLGKNLWFKVGGWRGAESWFPNEFKIEKTGGVGMGELYNGIGIRFFKVYLSIGFIRKYGKTTTTN